MPRSSGRAKAWIAAEVPYSMGEYGSDGYRRDCSGFVSMAWNLPGNEWTGSLDTFAQRIPKDRLEPGDMLLFPNPKDPQKGSHVVIFGGWTDYAETHYIAYESTRPYARRQATPYAYRNIPPAGNPGPQGKPPSPGGPASSGASGTPASHGVPGCPGRGMFRSGADNAFVTRLGQQLVKKGFGTYDTSGPEPRRGESDRRNVEAFQRAQGWRGGAADGYPGPETWRRLFS